MKETRQERKARKKAFMSLTKYYTLVQNDRTGYVQLTPREKAFQMIHGVMELGYRVNNLKDIYKEVQNPRSRKRNHNYTYPETGNKK